MSVFFINAFFTFFSSVLLFSSFMVVFTKDAVRGVLFLLLAFFAASALSFLIKAEFIAMILLLVSSGAVVVLFLFMVMTVHVQNFSVGIKKKGNVIFIACLFFAFLLELLWGVQYLLLSNADFSKDTSIETINLFSDNNLANIAKVLYTDFLDSFYIAGLILFVVMVAAICLTFVKRSKSIKHQSMLNQVSRGKDSVVISNAPLK